MNAPTAEKPTTKTAAQDSELITRIWTACHERDLDTLHEETARAWEICSNRWGVRSPAALGCLLALVRLAWGLPHASAVRIVTAAGSPESTWFPEGAQRTDKGGWQRHHWCVRPGEQHDKRELAGNSHATEPDALLAALRSAPVTP